MKKLLALAALTCGVVLCAPAAQAVDGHHVFPLLAQNGSGEIGAVVLTPVGTKTRVEIALGDSPPGVEQPAHVHVGPCSKLNPKPAYGLASVVDGYSVTTLDVPVDTLLNGTFAVNVHKSATDASVYVACGDLK
jgi:hypothetical protein